MKTKLNWRLSKLPTPEELVTLVKEKIVTQEEAREILFSLETNEDRDKKSLEEEIKFLRGLVEQLSKNNSSRIVEVIREVEKPWKRYPWYEPYVVWCTNTSNTATGSVTYTSSTGGTVNAFNTSMGGSMTEGTTNTAFSSIKTF